MAGVNDCEDAEECRMDPDCDWRHICRSPARGTESNEELLRQAAASGEPRQTQTAC